MGVTYGVMCLDCGEEGPEVGDFGYIGYPSVAEDKGRRSIPNFGFIYRGLVMLGMRTPAVEDLRAFLLEHREHQMDISCEGESLFGEDSDDEESAGEDDLDEDDDEDQEDDEDEVEDDNEVEEDDEDDEDDEDEGEDEDEDGDEDEEAEEEGGDDGADPRGFVACYYEASCARCGQSARSEWEDAALPFEPKTLDKAEIREALSRVTVEESFDRASEPFGPDDFERICAFLQRHANHGPRVALIPKAGSTPRS